MVRENAQFALACRVDSTVLITGPTGSGKSRIARRIHESSRRARKPFVTINLACLHEGTLESELFGHERGSFTGADSRRVGRLELAQGGTVFLDEIGELPPRLQTRLLEFLQSRTICPVGGNREARLDVRIIAATHRKLESAVARGEFREDLFHRLRVITLQLPSLIERADDFDSLLHSCIEEVCGELGRSILEISEEVACRLEGYHWPGNFRELRHVLEYAVQAAEGSRIELQHLPQWFGSERAEEPAMGALGVAEFAFSNNYEESLLRFEKEFLRRALSRYGGRINRTARQVGMSKTTLIRRMRECGVSVGEEYRVG